MKKNGKNPVPNLDKKRTKLKPGWTEQEDGTLVHKGSANLHPAQPGEVRNPNGRAPDIVRGIALRIAQLKAGKILSDKELEKLKKLGLDTAGITVIESIVLDWATSTNPIKQQMYIERVAGRVPNINLNAQISEDIVKRFRSKLTDAELERIVAGEDALEILLEKLPDAGESDVIDAEVEDDDTNGGG